LTNIPLKDENSKYTDKQWQAIHDSGKNILVSASAGSGKTTVLVKRLIEKIKSGVNVDELLVVTFTNAAAREMKERIQLEIQEEINNQYDVESRRHLVNQLPLIGQANISTIHSFCLKVIQRFYYVINIDPVFRLLTDDTEVSLLKEEVLDEVLEESFEDRNENFIRLVETFSSDRNIEPFKELILSMYNFSMAHPNSKEWLESLSDNYDVDETSLTESDLFAGEGMLKDQISAYLETAVKLIESGINAGKGQEGLEKQLAQLELDLKQVKDLQFNLESGNLTKLYDQMNSLEFKGWPRLKKEYKDFVSEEYNRMKDFRDKQKKLLKDKLLPNFFLSSPEEYFDLSKKAKPVVEELAKVEKKFIQAYKSRKEDERLVDFNDLEHMTFDILKANEQDEISQAAAYYQNQFSEVMVDEYQDVNTLQEGILSLVSNQEVENGNQFLVGDIKQSIYGFRLANPSLFLDKYLSYPEDENKERIILAENFRSRDNVIDFINYLFTQLMNRDLGEFEYDENAELVNGFKDFPESNNFDTELLIFENEDVDNSGLPDLGEGSEEDVIRNRTEGELKIIAHRIRDLVDSKEEIYDKDTGANRPVSYKDIVLLTPTKNNNLEIQDQLKQSNIPVAINNTQNYFQTTEISTAMSLLKVIDNPRQDIPLTAILRSVVVGLNEKELATIRLQDKNVAYYDALINFYEQSNPSPLKEKIERFLDKLKIWREASRRESLAGLIWRIYNDTGLLNYVGGLSSGRQRKANLHALYERAASYESSSFKGLFQFIRFIEKMQQKDKDLAEPSTITEEDDAVRVMTIHASKGLEFPIVFVLDLAKQFNMGDIRKPYLFHEDYGVGIEYFDLESRVRYSTLPYIAIRSLKRNELLSEQMRVLYVALTRAEQKLFLVGTYKDQKTALKNWADVRLSEEKVLPSGNRSEANSMMDWIGMSLVRHNYFDEFDLPESGNTVLSNYQANFLIHFINKETLGDFEAEVVKEQEESWLKDLRYKTEAGIVNVDENEMIQQANQRMTHVYSDLNSTKTTSYQSVSEIKRLFDEPDDGKMVKLNVDELANKGRANRYVEDDFDSPKFIAAAEKEPTPSEIGQATHLLLQTLDLSERVDEEHVQKQLSYLVETEAFTEKVGSEIDIHTIIELFNSDFGRVIRQNLGSLSREVPFSMLIEAQEIFENIENTDDHILIHGIIDGFMEIDGEIILFDYKTDRVKHLGAHAKDQLIENYRGQLNLYKRAIESIVGKAVNHTYIVSLDLLEVIEI